MITVGWSAARVEILKKQRKLQCYGCLEFGHVVATCQGEDRSSCCYRCGKEGHRAAKCTSPESSCPLCSASEKPANHRMGGARCRFAPTVGRKSHQTPKTRDVKVSGSMRMETDNEFPTRETDSEEALCPQINNGSQDNAN